MSLTVNGVDPNYVMVKKINKATGEVISTTETTSVICNDKTVWKRNTWVGSAGGQGLWYTSNGKEWTQSNVTEGTYWGAQYHNGMWVAVTNDSTGNIAYSTDGRTWTVKQLETSYKMSVPRYGNGRWIICPRNNGDSSYNYYSDDGINWTKGSLQGSFWNGAYYANGVWIACSNNNVGIFYSTDNGLTWKDCVSQTEGVTLPTVAIGGVHFANGVWILASSSIATGIWYSTDGINWYNSSFSLANSQFNGGARYANGIWVACGAAYSKLRNVVGIFYSTDNGLTWQQSNITSGDWEGGARYANGIWVACSGSGYKSNLGLFYSEDGKTWTQSNVTSGAFKGGARFVKNIWVANYYDQSSNNVNGFYYSTDGKNWTKSNLSDMPKPSAYDYIQFSAYSDNMTDEELVNIMD